MISIFCGCLNNDILWLKAHSVDVAAINTVAGVAARLHCARNCLPGNIMVSYFILVGIVARANPETVSVQSLNNVATLASIEHKAHISSNGRGAVDGFFIAR